MTVTDGTARAGAELQATVAALARAASIELATRDLSEIDGYGALVPAGTDVYVAWLPRMPYHHVASAARRLREVGMNPVPHIAARQFASRDAAADFLARLRDGAGVTRALLVAGDCEQIGPYASSADFLASGLLEAHGVRSVGVAGYPEGHPRLDLDALDAALDRKIAQASGRGIELFVVTQFCFDGDAILAWLARLRARGVALPVRVGVAGPTRIRTLLAYAARCGIGDSIRALRAHAISLPHLLAEHRADEVVRRIAAGGPRPGVAGLHCFPFGGFAQAARWLGAAASGPLPRA
ncbi:MAG: methylenetetrahydrofolate reductase [Burkholderiales bacterium]